MPVMVTYIKMIFDVKGAKYEVSWSNIIRVYCYVWIEGM